jgi:hypothetical protein
MSRPTSPAAELGDLVAGLLGSVVAAQETIDIDAQARTDAWLNDRATEDPTPPPLWFTVGSTALEVQLAARVVATASGRPSLRVRTANPVDAALHGHEASTQVRLRVIMDSKPRPPLPLYVVPSEEDDDGGSGEDGTNDAGEGGPDV